MAAYKEPSEDHLVEDLHSRKEFAQLWVPPREDDFRWARADASSGTRAGAPLQTHQQFVRAFMNPNTPNMRMHLMHSTGCHARGTLIMRADGARVPVETISVGTLLAHPDGAHICSRVTELHRGYEMMYRVSPRAKEIAGEPALAQEVNGGHILHMRNEQGALNLRVRYLVECLRKERHRAFFAQWYLAYVRQGALHYAEFSIEPIGKGAYFGFAVEQVNTALARTEQQDRLYLTGDGLITHNSGKCLGRGTLVASARGTIPVESIVVGDQLVGDDGRARIVESLASGVDQCYLVSARARAHAFAPFVCNSAHILTLARVSTGKLVDIPIEQLLAMRGRDSLDDWRIARIARRARIARVVYCQFDVTPIGVRDYFGFTLAQPCNGRFLLGDGTITHNTRAAISVAQECVKMYRVIYRDVDWRSTSIVGPSIFIIAFGGKHAFLQDLIKYPEFGYATGAEYSTYLQFARAASESDEAYRKYKRFAQDLKRRITNRAHGGYYKFIGYDEFANRLFGADIEQLQTLVSDARERHEPIAWTLERAIESGRIHPNEQLLAQLENSLIICDEIHNTYNTQAINNRGIAIQFVLDHVRSARFLSLSATPINGVPAEICDFANYFVPVQRDKVARELLFSGNTPAPGTIAHICELLRGRISFLFDYDPRQFPARIDHGIALRARERGAMPYLKFTPCEMSSFFANTIREFYSLRASLEQGAARGDDARGGDDAPRDEDDNVIGIPQTAYSLFDMVFPNPDESAKIGLYDSSSIYGVIGGAPQEWRDRVGIAIKNAGGIRTFSGPFLRAPQLATYSAKYARLVSLIPELIRATGPCKIMVYHERVRATGVALIREILRENGIIEENDNPSDGTLCAICARARAEHARDGAHEFRPLRFAAIYSELDTKVRAQIHDRFRSRANLHGEQCSILVGSKLIRESYDFNAVRHLIVLSLPISISQLIQVFGRCVRRRSHAELPENERDVGTWLLVNTTRVTGDGLVDDIALAPEVRRYALKLESYLTVQQIERELARGAVDAGINHNALTLARGEGALGLLAFDEAIKFTMERSAGKPLRVDTFFAYGYGAQEIAFVLDIVRRLFAERGIWRERDLRSTIRAPPFGVQTNPRLILDSSIDIALAFLVAGTNNMDRAIVGPDGARCFVVASRAGDDVVLSLAPIETVEVAGIARARAILDTESFLRGASAGAAAVRDDVIPIAHFDARESLDDTIRAELLARFANEGGAKATAAQSSRARIARMSEFLTAFAAEQQQLIARQFVANEEFRAEFSQLYDFMHALGIFIDRSYVSKYKDVARRLTQAQTERDGPVAYGDGNVVQLFTGDEWMAIGRNALNMHAEYDENDTVVGVFKQFPYGVKFQLREPVSQLRAQKPSDARIVKRGSVCTTRARAETERVAARLGISREDVARAISVSDLCNLVRIALLTREIKERANSRSLAKYVYGWWDNAPALY